MGGLDTQRIHGIKGLRVGLGAGPTHEELDNIHGIAIYCP